MPLARLWATSPKPRRCSPAERPLPLRWSLQGMGAWRLVGWGLTDARYAELVSPWRSQRWTWVALAGWLGRAGLALLIAAGLLWGPLLADKAWDQGVHVTPAQSALHGALIANGFAHHHGVPLPTAHTTGTGFQAGSSATSWGTPLTQALQSTAEVCPVLAPCYLMPTTQLPPQSAALPPLSPPPEAVLIF